MNFYGYRELHMTLWGYTDFCVTGKEFWRSELYAKGCPIFNGFLGKLALEKL